MIEKIVIVGLRAIDPLPVGFGSDCLPGYLCEATETHRRGFQLPGVAGWYAFKTDSLQALEFDSEINARFYIQLLLKHDPGRWRPLTMVTIFK